MGPTERLEEPLIEAVLEQERIPNHGDYEPKHKHEVPEQHRYSFVIDELIGEVDG